MSTTTVQSLLEKTKDFSVEETLAFLANEYSKQVVFSTSFGQEDQVITDFIANFSSTNQGIFSPPNLTIKVFIIP